MALAMGAMFAINAYFQFATGVGGWLFLGVAILLIVGSFRTLRKMSGGLRLLAGAWGLAAGIQMLPLISGSWDTATRSPLGLALILAALGGLALTVLHKESKA